MKPRIKAWIVITLLAVGLFAWAFFKLTDGDAVDLAGTLMGGAFGAAVLFLLIALAVAWLFLPFFLFARLGDIRKTIETSNRLTDGLLVELRNGNRRLDELHEIQANAIHELDAIRRHTKGDLADEATPPPLNDTGSEP